jgi:hypothetical protein
MPKTLKELISEEYVKCAKDPIYFFKKYCYIQHPHRGKILFNLYDFQEGLIDSFKSIPVIGKLLNTEDAIKNMRLMAKEVDKNGKFVYSKSEIIGEGIKTSFEGLGKELTGKSSLYIKLIEGKFNENYFPSHSTNIYIKDFN